jgi:NAD(P)-dependent dehydrogenase (short-subunit alcohol dehydrogenase family)
MGEADPIFVEKLLAGDEAGAGAYIETKDGQTAYAHGKFAISVWMRRNASRFIADGVRINAIAPGYITTALTEAGGEDPVFGPAMAAFVETIPVGRPGVPADIAHPVVWLLSAEASFVCGSVLYADGGHDAMLRPDSY